MRLGTRRDPALTLVLIFITCGLYWLYFIYTVSREVAEFRGEQDYSPGVEILLTIVTCGLWNVYWDYRMGKHMAQMCQTVLLPSTDNATLYVVLDLLGIGGLASVGVVNAVLQQDTLNRIWKAAMNLPPDAQPVPGIWPPPPVGQPPIGSTPRVPRQPKP